MVICRRVELDNDADILATIEWVIRDRARHWQAGTAEGETVVETEDESRPCLLDVLLHQAHGYDTVTVTVTF